MSESTFTANSHIPQQQRHAALLAVLNILEKWGCTTEEQMALLGVETEAVFDDYLRDPVTIDISLDTMERLSYLLNIHALLRTQFSDPASVYRWVKKPNSAPFFDGRSAMDVMTQGKVADLYEIMQRLSLD
ncbi:antitoxin Xre/MbcA/ParS toxin-binding domain-containing protein [Nitrincola sp.]|uniref:antitoxin Xre/MbcA/ParS toxin-binding domain-containing protein n=1 Tax=Nitrincola sp. TaxID=1926584 RepID=UPI003A93D495